ncbi:hypothetical protein GGX14DRAFT_533276 [Mycena pura]|uniref:ER transporter 6TM N-terminal domain-containing protein n=1 Tax=Mycena pura TaxID=153505 RepID=A0AAD6VTK2_9AGAR|nr:hypothetical protein GGX14DRAFT_533276 [Mycena pura]
MPSGGVNSGENYVDTEKDVSGSSAQSRSSSESSQSLQWPSSLQWVPANYTWAKLKPAIRCSVAAWISVVVFLIPKAEVFLGQASFLILIIVKSEFAVYLAAFMTPPNDPFMSVLERELTILLFVTTTWAWSCLGIKLADLARVNHNPSATFAEAISGQYLEVAPSVIFGLFIFFGTTILLYIRARNVPSQIFACVLGCLYISLTTAALYPYPFYVVGKTIVLPISFHSAIAILSSIIVFPSTVSSQFTTRLGLVLAPLAKSFELHEAILKKDPYSPEFSSTAAAIVASVSKSEAALVPLAASGRLLKSDLNYSRYPPTDFIALQQVAKRMAVRAHGMTVYLGVLDPIREKFPVTPGVGGTPMQGSPVISRPPSPPRTLSREHTEDHDTDGDNVPPTPTRWRHSNHSRHHNLLVHSLHLSLGRKKPEHARYLDLEANLVHPEVEAHTKESAALLSQSCTPLLKTCQDSLIWVQDWLRYVRQGTLRGWIAGRKRRQALEQRVGELQKIREALRYALNEFRNDKRHLVLEPWRPSFDPNSDPEQEMPPHRHLFHCYVYQYHLIQVSTNIITMLDAIHNIEQGGTKERLWTPAPIFLDWTRSAYHLSDFGDDEEDPDRIDGVPPDLEEYDLGTARRRDPDALPPRNHVEWAMSLLYRGFATLGTGNALFALKAATLTVIMSLPALLKTSATFAYENKFVWAVFMSQVTLARFRGDTVFGLSRRVLSTFLGVILGMAMWYVSTGSGSGNAYGLAAVCAVCFPFFFYGRLYWPGPPMGVIILFVTAVLVIGYSYQDHYIPAPGNPGFGWEVAWRRFILVTSGVLAAGIFSLLPPSTTIRRYERTVMATSTSEIGTIYCDIISFASSKRSDTDPQAIVTALIAVRSKIHRAMALKGNAVYEFSLKGRWPAKRYHQIMQVQLQLAYSLSHLMSVVEHMEPAWTRAFLRRTRFLDSDFQGDVLAVISMISTALRTGTALPQITPCPLLDRFQTQYGLHVIHKDSEEDYGLPRTLTLDTLQNEQYLKFCVGVATAYNIMSRLDRLMHTVKEIVGEQYHIHGAGAPSATRGVTRGGGVSLGSRTNTIQFRAPQEV